MSSVSKLTRTSSKTLIDHNSFNVSPNSKSLQHGNGLLGLRNLSNGVIKNQRNLINLHNSMSSSHNKWSACGGSNGGGKSVSSLMEINLSVPSSPGVERMGHSTFSAHVTEGSLTRTVSTTSGNSWNSCNGSSGTPGFSRVFHTSLSFDTMSLSAVSAQLMMNEINDIISNWSHEHMWHF